MFLFCIIFTWQLDGLVGAAETVGRTAGVLAEVWLVDFADDERVTPPADGVDPQPSLSSLGDDLPAPGPDHQGGGVGVDITDQLHLVLAAVGADKDLRDLDLRGVEHLQLHCPAGLRPVPVGGGALVEAGVLPPDLPEEESLAGDVGPPVRQPLARPLPGEAGRRLTWGQALQPGGVAFPHLHHWRSGGVDRRRGWNCQTF